jgi:hypothetical protein
MLLMLITVLRKDEGVRHLFSKQKKCQTPTERRDGQTPFLEAENESAPD